MLWEIAQGSVRILAIEDGGHLADAGVVFPASDRSRFPDQMIWLSFGCFLIEKGEELALVDVGFGSDRPIREGVVSGQLVDALDTLDIDPGSIGAVVQTHVHPDHVGGHIRGGEVLFRNADVFVHDSELIRAPWSNDPLPDVVRGSLMPLRERGQLHAVTKLSKLPMGLGILETPGHTSGHISIEVATDDGPVLIAGDVTHHPIQQEHPDWYVQADVDIPAANAARRALFERAARTEAILACGHYRKPGFGRVVADGGAWRFVPPS